MRFKFYKRKEYADYSRLPEKDSIINSLYIMYDNDYILSPNFDIELSEPCYIYAYEIPDEYVNFCKRIRIDDKITLYDILYPTNNIVGMVTDDIKDAFVIDESYVGYLDKAIRYIKLHDDSVFFEFNTDDDIVKMVKERDDETSKYYILFKAWIEGILKDMTKTNKLYDDFRYAEIVVKQV